ncbi:hypothetical protein [Arenibacter algicola]|uniref:hypothetical protein n=1 Tax=Arenibacter algicola TaxID=616991 RepID=UPI000BB451F2|nr:hypothetical protein [Arenibacter algicola]
MGTTLNSKRFSSIFDPDPKGEIEENQATFSPDRYREGKTDFPKNLTRTIFAMYPTFLQYFLG